MATGKSKNEGVAAFKSGIDKYKKHWKEARKAENKGGFLDGAELAEELGLEEDDTITCTCRITSLSVGVSKGGDPYVSFSGVIAKGEHKGLPFSKYQGIRDDKSFGYAVADIKTLGFDVAGLDTVEELADALADDIIPSVAAEKPGVSVTFKWNGEFLNLFFNRKVQFDSESASDDGDETEEEETQEEAKPKRKSKAKAKSAPAPEPSDDGLDDEEEDDETEEDDDESSEEDEEEIEVIIPEKDDTPKWLAPKTRKAAIFTVTAVSESKGTCTLKNPKTGDIHKGVPFDELIWPEN